MISSTARSLPIDNGATGVGTAIGIGRIGAILSPTIAGGLLDVGWTPESLYITVGGVSLKPALPLGAAPPPPPTRSPAARRIRQLRASKTDRRNGHRVASPSLPCRVGVGEGCPA